MRSARILAAGPASAASKDARAEFHSATQAACRALVQAPPEAALTVKVNLGSDLLGVALVAMRLADGSAAAWSDLTGKQGGRAVLTAPLRRIGLARGA